MIKMRKKHLYMNMARSAASFSKDRSTQVGAILVDQHGGFGPSGYNGFARNIDDDRPERHDRPLKYDYTLHAEMNAIITSARQGFATHGCELFVTHHPCARCASAIVNAGIWAVYTYRPNFTQPHWQADCEHAMQIFREGGVSVMYLDEPEAVSPAADTGNNGAAAG